jgi:hypothetical protein
MESSRQRKYDMPACFGIYEDETNINTEVHVSLIALVHVSLIALCVSRTMCLSDTTTTSIRTSTATRATSTATSLLTANEANEANECDADLQERTERAKQLNAPPESRYIHVTAKDSGSDSDNVESDAESNAESSAELQAGSNAESNAELKTPNQMQAQKNRASARDVPNNPPSFCQSPIRTTSASAASVATSCLYPSSPRAFAATHAACTCTSAQDGRRRRPCS